MTKLTQAFIESGVALLVGLAIVGSLMFAFAGNASAETRTVPVGSTLSVSIGANGMALVRGAEVTAVSGSTLTAKTQWGDAALTWTVRTDGDTSFVEKNGAGTTFATIETGDTVSFSGTIDDDLGAFTVDADVVRNWSQDQGSAVVTGTVTAVDEDDDSFTLDSKQHGTITVDTSGSTSYVGGAFADIDVGDKLVVSGGYNASTDVVTATKITLNAGVHLGEGKKDWKNWMKDMPIWKWFNKNDK